MKNILLVSPILDGMGGISSVVRTLMNVYLKTGTTGITKAITVNTRPQKICRIHRVYKTFVKSGM
ncbi:hypothetical protein QA601_06450 [Chitinispirillales bacterium ANBcel5]|uniref:hypothetical protein n=1 Tax=Cellulosispirillum alkaliphilum TaxID=3039283 RepID=UPI002A53CB3C|nr:hypothetical protein [Chitinispirillales bacterium ANBcel5]